MAAISPLSSAFSEEVSPLAIRKAAQKKREQPLLESPKAKRWWRNQEPAMKPAMIERPKQALEKQLTTANLAWRPAP